MKKFLIQVILLLTVIGAAFFVYGANQSGKKIDIPFLPQGPTLKNMVVNGSIIKVEVADTQNIRKKGLGGRESLASDSGMLFIFEKEDRHAFWMKGLKFPLDFIWIRGEVVADILENVSPPAPGQDDASLPIYSSKVDINKVLEVNAGTAQRLNIKVGDEIKLE